MYSKKLIFLLVAGLISTAILNAQFKKYDSTLKVAKAGYRVYCNNKNVDKNNITLTPIGFESGASREVNFEIKGRVKKCETDDLNNDGFPDLVIYVYDGKESAFGKVLAIYSEKNESFGPIGFPDILDDPKLKIGYKGYDEFSLMEGVLVRRFPIFQAVDSVNFVPSGMLRQIHYRVVAGENHSQKFKVLRTFEFKKQ
jgi:hypothetical protein